MADSAHESNVLIRQAKEGDADALGSLLDSFRGHLRTLAQRELGGSLQAKLEGSGTVQTLAFDGTASVTGRDITTGTDSIDPNAVTPMA